VAAYEARFTDTFADNLRRYASYRRQTQHRVDRILDDPYHNTESLANAAGGLNLKGCRSARIDRNFRIVFVICEECQRMEECEYCLCDDCPDKSVVFLTFGPHARAYSMR